MQGTASPRMWRRVDLGDAMMAPAELAHLETAAKAAYSRNPTPGFAVLTRHESEGRLHCALLAYFSPEAAELARSFGAVACHAPGPGNLALLAGDAAVLESL